MKLFNRYSLSPGTSFILFLTLTTRKSPFKYRSSTILEGSAALFRSYADSSATASVLQKVQEEGARLEDRAKDKRVLEVPAQRPQGARIQECDRENGPVGWRQGGHPRGARDKSRAQGPVCVRVRNDFALLILDAVCLLPWFSGTPASVSPGNLLEIYICRPPCSCWIRNSGAGAYSLCLNPPAQETLTSLRSENRWLCAGRSKPDNRVSDASGELLKSAHSLVAQGHISMSPFV